MLKIAILSANNNNGGASRATRRIAKALTNSSLNNKFLYEFICNGVPEVGYFQRKPIFKWYAHLFYNNHKLEPIFKGIFNKIWKKINVVNTENDYLFSRIGNSINYKKTFEKIDLIHIFWGQTFVNPKEIANLAKPTIITLHDMWFINGGFSYFDKATLDKEKYLNWLGKRNFENQFKQKINLINKSNTRLVVTSNWMKKKVLEIGVDSKKITKILNYIPNHYRYLNDKENCQELIGWDKNTKFKKIIYFSGLITDSRKGFNFLVESVKDLSPEIKSQIALQILGHNFSKIDLLEKIDIEYKVLGVFSDELSQVIAYNSADILICPSEFDNTPNVIAEAQMCGLPCIALEGTGGAEMIENGTTGFVSPQKKVDYLMGLISDFVCNKTNFDNERISKLAIQKYSFENTCKKYIQLYKSLL